MGVYIHPDSMAAPTALQNRTMKSNLTPECHNTLNNLVKERAVELLGFPVHNAFSGNPIIDDLGLPRSSSRMAATYRMQTRCGNIKRIKDGRIKIITKHGKRQSVVDKPRPIFPKNNRTAATDQSGLPVLWS